MIRERSWVRIVLGVLVSLWVIAGSIASAQTIQVWVSGRTEQEFLESVYMPKFRAENPGIEVEFYQTPLQEVFDRLVAGVVSGTGPDIIATGNTTVFNLSNVGLLAPIDRYLAEWDGYDAVWPAAWYNQRFSGVTYGVPMYSAARGIYYRADVAQEVGLDPDAPPQSWTELLTWADRLTRVDGDRVVRAGYAYQGNHYQEWTFWLNQAGGALISDDLRTATFNSQAGIDAINQMLNLGRASRYMDLGPPPATGANGIVNDAVGMMINHSGLISSIANADPGVAEVTRIFPPRRDASSAPKALTFTDGFAIPSTSQHPDAAWAFLAGMLDQEIAVRFANDLGRIVPRNDLLGLIDDRFTAGYQLLEYYVPYPTMPEGAWLSSTFNTEFGKVLSGTQSPQAALEIVETGYVPRVREYWDSVSR